MMEDLALKEIEPTTTGWERDVFVHSAINRSKKIVDLKKVIL